MVWALAGRRGAVPLLEALQRRPELQKHAVHRDVLGRQQFLPAGLIQDAIEELEWSHIGSSSAMPGNQRNRML